MSNDTEMILKAFGDFQCEMKTELGNLREEMLQRIQDVKTEMTQQIQDVKTEMTQQIQDVKKEVKTLSKRLDETQNELREFSQRSAVFEVEISDKVAALFDAYVVNNEKHAAYEDSITSLNAKVFNHQIRIEKIEGMQQVV